MRSWVVQQIYQIGFGVISGYYRKQNLVLLSFAEVVPPIVLWVTLMLHFNFPFHTQEISLGSLLTLTWPFGYKHNFMERLFPTHRLHCTLKTDGEIWHSVIYLSVSRNVEGLEAVMRKAQDDLYNYSSSSLVLFSVWSYFGKIKWFGAEAEH